MPRILAGNLRILDEVSVEVREGAGDVITTRGAGQDRRTANAVRKGAP